MTDDVGLDQVVAAASRELEAGREVALATIVGTRGSTYRRAGARLLVRADGSWVGNVSGGCIEGEIVDVGGRVIDSGEPELVTYDLTADEEAIWGWGLGCNGVIEVLVEPTEAAAQTIGLLAGLADASRSQVLVTVVRWGGASPVPHARRALVTGDGKSVGELPASVLAAAKTALDDGRTSRRSVELDAGGLDVLLEVVRPPRRLLVCGAGHDAIPVVRCARMLGWDPIVVDDRASFLSPDRFPEAAGLVHSRPEDAAPVAGVRERTAVVIMSHNFLRDAEYLRAFLGTGVDYIGMLGPSRRAERVLEHLAKEGIRPSPDDEAKLRGPAGLDLGAEGPDEIAWSIVAEILAAERGRRGGPLTERDGPIHADARHGAD